jgi:hypothetical protein
MTPEQRAAFEIFEVTIPEMDSDDKQTILSTKAQEKEVPKKKAPSDELSEETEKRPKSNEPAMEATMQ